jgi:antitoxin ParD1/3/4
MRRCQMPTRNVVLTSRNQAMIDTLVGSGRYQNASEVLRDGLRLIEQREAEDEAKLAALREAAALGVAAVESGKARRFENGVDLAAYLRSVGNKAIASAPVT